MFKGILVPLDGSVLAEGVLPHAVAAAQAFGATVTLMHVLESAAAQATSYTDPIGWQMSIAHAESYLSAKAKRFLELRIPVEQRIVEGDAAQQIADAANAPGIDLLLMSNLGRSGFRGWNVGGTLLKVLQSCRSSILLVRASKVVQPESHERAYGHIMVPLDGSQRAEYSLPAAIALAEASRATVLLAHTVRRPEMPHRLLASPDDRELIEGIVTRNQRECEAYLRKISARLEARGLRVASSVHVADNPSETLHTLAEQESVDLMVMTAHGLSGSAQRPVGDVATSLVVHGTCTLLLIQDLTPQQEQLARGSIPASV